MAWHYLLDFKLELLLGLQLTCILAALTPLKRHFLAILSLASAVYNRRSTLLSVLWFTGSLVWFVFLESYS